MHCMDMAALYNFVSDFFIGTLISSDFSFFLRVL